MHQALATFVKQQLGEMTVREAAEQWNMPRSTINALITNPEQRPTLPTLEKLAHATGVPLYYVLALAGCDLGWPADPDEECQRWADVLRRVPTYRTLVEQWVQLPTEEQQKMLAYLEVASSRG